MSKLTGMRCYLAGAMDKAVDGGVGWREHAATWLEGQHGVIILDPCHKPIDIGIEDMENREYRRELKQKGQFELLAREMRTIRVVDLRMVDLADFCVINLDVNVHTCGTYEELFWANRCKKPVIVHVEGGKAECPDWLFGTLPEEHIFGSWANLYAYLDDISDGTESHKRFMFFHEIVHRKYESPKLPNVQFLYLQKKVVVTGPTGHKETYSFDEFFKVPEAEAA